MGELHGWEDRLTARDAGGQGLRGGGLPPATVVYPLPHLQSPICSLHNILFHLPSPLLTSLGSTMASQNLLPEPTASNHLFLHHEILYQPESSRTG